MDRKLLFGLLVVWLLPGLAWGQGPYQIWEDIQPDPVIVTPADGASVPACAIITVNCQPSGDRDWDEWIDDWVVDPIHYTWYGPGTIIPHPNDGTYAEWFTPTQVQDNAEISVDANDSPLADDDIATGTTHVNIVGAVKMQYHELGAGDVDVNDGDTIYVLKGTSVTFKGVLDTQIQGALFAPFWPRWSTTSGTSPASGTDSYLCSFDVPGYYTVTVEAGNTVTVNVRVYELTLFAVPDIDYEGRDHGTYGIRERLRLRFDTGIYGPPPDQIGQVQWDNMNGYGGLGEQQPDNSMKFQAGNSSSETRIRLTLMSGPSRGEWVEFTFDVITPGGVHYVHGYSGFGMWHRQGTASIGARFMLFVSPDSVPFFNVGIRIREGETWAYAEGFWEEYYGEHHNIGPVEGTEITGWYLFGQEGLLRDTAQTVSKGPPFSNGLFQWNIPQHFNPDYQSDPYNWNLYCYSLQEHTCDQEGTATVQKRDSFRFEKRADEPDCDY